MAHLVTQSQYLAVLELIFVFDWSDYYYYCFFAFRIGTRIGTNITRTISISISTSFRIRISIDTRIVVGIMSIIKP